VRTSASCPCPCGLNCQLEISETSIPSP
jgi:hypothetical protein